MDIYIQMQALISIYTRSNYNTQHYCNNSSKFHTNSLCAVNSTVTTVVVQSWKGIWINFQVAILLHIHNPISALQFNWHGIMGILNLALDLLWQLHHTVNKRASHLVRKICNVLLYQSCPTRTWHTAQIPYNNRVTVFTSQNKWLKHFCDMKFQMAAKQSYCLICIPDWVVAHFNCHGNCTTTTVTVDILELVKFQASCIQSQCMGVCVSTGGNWGEC